ncbi:hypothetical protein DL93DRAFT_2080974 [Clavulina sp. PMI_390]|nr:hypothetical protein DL93DRAFT_2080974 [Clavulina sp. PMI_390]
MTSRRRSGQEDLWTHYSFPQLEYLSMETVSKYTMAFDISQIQRSPRLCRLKLTNLSHSGKLRIYSSAHQVEPLTFHILHVITTQLIGGLEFLHTVATSLPDLRTLRLSKITSMGPAGNAAASSNIFSGTSDSIFTLERLGTLEFSGCSPEVVQGLTGKLAVPSLRKLLIHLGTDDDSADRAPASEDSLKNLSISLGSMLSSCPKLQQLEVGGLAPSLHVLTTALASLGKNSMKQLNSLAVTLSPSTDEEDWKLIADDVWNFLRQILLRRGKQARYPLKELVLPRKFTYYADASTLKKVAQCKGLQLSFV